MSEARDPAASAERSAAGPVPAAGSAAGLVPIPAEAWTLLTSWLPANDDPERPQITLATTAIEGGPDLRTVLLTSFDATGLVVNTDAASRKAAQIAHDPRVAIAVLWPGFSHQLVVRGTATELDPEEREATFRTRSPYLQQLAWLNTHEFAGLPPEERRERWTTFTSSHPEGFDVSPTWTGFRVRPVSLTFWSSAADTASSRVEFTLRDGSWSRAVLPG